MVKQLKVHEVAVLKKKFELKAPTSDARVSATGFAVASPTGFAVA
jgi:hypothetical protein